MLPWPGRAGVAQGQHPPRHRGPDQIGHQPFRGEIAATHPIATARRDDGAGEDRRAVAGHRQRCRGFGRGTGIMIAQPVILGKGPAGLVVVANFDVMILATA